MAKDMGITTDEAIGIAKGYIMACQSPEAIALDPMPCKSIGGKPQILILQPGHEPEWVVGYEPPPQTWRQEWRSRHLPAPLA